MGISKKDAIGHTKIGARNRSFFGGSLTYAASRIFRRYIDPTKFRQIKNLKKIKIFFLKPLTNRSACVIIDTEREQRGKQND